MERCPSGLRGGLAEWQCAGFENQWAQALRGSSPLPSARYNAIIKRLWHVTTLKKYGFKIKRAQTFSIEYSAFTSAQSIISLITKTNNIFFNSIQTGKFTPYIILHLALFAFLFPICFLINILLYFSDKGEVVLVTAEKAA